MTTVRNDTAAVQTVEGLVFQPGEARPISEELTPSEIFDAVVEPLNKTLAIALDDGDFALVGVVLVPGMTPGMYVTPATEQSVQQDIINETIPEAPSDGVIYGRQDETWAPTLPEAPSDGVSYARKDEAWAPTLPEAPIDGTVYGRQNEAWAPVTASPAFSNEVVVDAADPFANLPAPVGGVITLPADSSIRIVGNVDIGANTFELPASSVLRGSDPLVDSLRSSNGIAVQLPDGGTVREVSIGELSGTGGAISIGGGTPGLAVVYNVSLASNGTYGVEISGNMEAVTVSRIRTTDCEMGVCVGPGATVGALNVDQQVWEYQGQGPGSAIRCDVAGNVSAFSYFESVAVSDDPGTIGVDLRSPTTQALRVGSCAFFGPGTPSFVAQGAPFSNATVGSCAFGESVGCLGYDNSIQRGSMQVAKCTTLVPVIGNYYPIGNGGSPKSYTLAPNSVRVSKTGGPTAETQALIFERVAPYSAEITVSISVQVGLGFSFNPRIISARVLINGVPVGDSWESTTPTFTSPAPTILSFVTPATLKAGDLVSMEISNFTDTDDLDVLAGRITIT